jgi:hypothetical protein
LFLRRKDPGFWPTVERLSKRPIKRGIWLHKLKELLLVAGWLFSEGSPKKEEEEEARVKRELRPREEAEEREEKR